MRFWRLKQAKSAVWCATLAACAFGASATRAQQTYNEPYDAVALAKRAVLVGSEAYVVLAPEPVSGPSKGRVVYPSPNGAYLLVTKTALPTPTVETLLGQYASILQYAWCGMSSVYEETFHLPGGGQPSRAELTVTLWDVAHRRSTLLWRETRTPTQYVATRVWGWLPGSSMALGQTTTAPHTGDIQADEKQVQTRLLLFDAERGTTRTLAAIEPGTDVRICSTQPKAVLLSRTQNTVQLVRANGAMGRKIAVARSDVFWYGWRSDGRTVYGSVLLELAHDDKGTPVVKTVLMDTETGTVTEQNGEPPDSWKQPQEAPLSRPLPLQTTFGDENNGSSKANGPLWLSGMGNDAEGRVLLAADAQKPFFLPGAVVYEAQGTLFAATLVRINRQAFLAARRDAYIEVVRARAAELRDVIAGYLARHKTFPAPGAAWQAFAVEAEDREIFNNPETGRPAFEWVNKPVGTNNPTGNDNTLWAYLSGPGGRVAIYEEGPPWWESTKP